MEMHTDLEIYSTPPTTPNLVVEPPAEHLLTPSLSRRNSRMSSLRIDSTKQHWDAGIVLEDQSPMHANMKTPRQINHIRDIPASAAGAAPATRANGQMVTPPQSSTSSSPSSIQNFDTSNMPVKSPCFVHSHLDKGASLSDWLHARQDGTLGSDLGVAKSLQRNGLPHHSRTDTVVEIPSPDGTSETLLGDNEDGYGGSLTKQLAETAVGVREMSKQLGRARVRSNIQSVLIVTKARDNRLIQLTRQLALYLMLRPRSSNQRGLVVYVDHQLRHSRRFDAAGIERDHPHLFVPLPRRRSSSSISISSLSSTSMKEENYVLEEGQLRYWTSDMCSRSPHLFDFVVTLGGDGTVLFTSWLFQRIVPPVLPFALGSLGFLTNFDFADHQAVVDSAIDSGIRVNLRMRFTCTVYRAVFGEGKCRKAVKKAETGEILMKNIEKGGWEALEGGWSGGFSSEGGKCSKDKEIMCFTTRPVETFEVLNDLVVDRGPSPYVSLLELFGDEHHMTTVQADGLTVSTPTGSTAYSLSAGGSLVHPEIPAILITPICPHTLSFRPMLLPDSMELRICVPYNSRSTAWASFDGRGRVELKQGDHIKITASKYPFPTVCADKQSTDWFHSISRTLKWNERERQKSFVVVEEGPARRKRSKRAADSPVSGVDNATKAEGDPLQELEETLEDEEEDEVSDDEEDKFDIDDSSPEASNNGNGHAIHVPNEQTARDMEVGVEKAMEQAAGKATGREMDATPEMAALALSQGNKFMRRAKSRSRSRSGVKSGVDTPGRFAGPSPHPPKISPRHVNFAPDPLSASSSSDSLLNMEFAQRGARDDIHSPSEYYSNGKSKIPKDLHFDGDNLQTPTMSDALARRSRHRVSSKDAEQHPHRAFAVWGQDESDSNASDSDA